MLADLGVHLFVAAIYMNADASSFELVGDFVGIVDVALGNGNDNGLHGRQPHWECAGIVLDQHAEESLDRSVKGAMYHHRLLAGAVFCDILEAEARGKVEVELDSRKLPQPADRVDKLDVNLRAVECGFAWNGLV